MTRAVSALAVEVQRSLEGLYGLERGDPVTEFLIPEKTASDLPGDGRSRTLVAQEGDELSLGVVLAESVHDSLERSDPRERLDAANIGPFCTLTEEVSHFVYLQFCAGAERSITELELELQGEVDKYVSASFLLSVQSGRAPTPRLRELLFRRYQLAEGLSAEQAERYHAASALAYRYCGFLEERFLRERRLADLFRESRRFYRLGQRQKLERISGLG